MSSQPTAYSRRANSSAATPVAASSPYSEPPARQIADTHSCPPIVPGEPPRTSVAAVAPPGKWKTVQPVGPSSYSATPISRPGKSSSSAGPSKSVRGGGLAREPGVRDHELAVRAQRAAAAPLVEPREDERRHVLACDAPLPRL